MSTNMNDFMAMLEDQLNDSDISFSDLSTLVSLKITEARLKMNMNQKQFADYLGVSQSMVSRWESECYNFTLKTICEILDKLDIKVSLLFSSKTSSHWDTVVTPSVSVKFDPEKYQTFMDKSFNKYENNTVVKYRNVAN